RQTLFLARFLNARLRRGAYLGLLVAGVVLAYSANASLRAQSLPKGPASAARIDLRPKLIPGVVLRYQVQLQTITDTKRTGAISDPQGPSRLAITWDATVKLEVLSVAGDPVAIAPAPKAGAGKTAGAESNAS